MRGLDRRLRALEQRVPPDREAPSDVPLPSVTDDELKKMVEEFLWHYAPDGVPLSGLSPGLARLVEEVLGILDHARERAARAAAGETVVIEEDHSDGPRVR